MLIGLKIKNFRSIRDKIFIDFTKARKISHQDLPSNYFKYKDTWVLKSMIVYGRNASGKSNVLLAINALKYLVENSGNFKTGQAIPPYEPFLFESKYRRSPVEFEIDFLSKDKTRFNYKIKFDKQKILYEGLFFYPKGAPAKLFERSHNKIGYGDYFKGEKKSIEEGLLENQLFLSKTATSKYLYLSDAYSFFSRYLFVSTIHDTEYDKTLIRAFSEICLEDKVSRKNIQELLKASDTNILGFDIAKNDRAEFKFPDNMPKEIQDEIADRYKYEVKTKHEMFENDRVIGEEELNLEEESLGTKKLMAIGGLIISTLTDGGIIVIDELDKGLHTILTKLLINLFHSEKNNPNNAQLLFATHDSSLLDSDLFRRDQICFIDKEYEGNTIFYKMSDIKGVRKDLPFDKWYLSGRFSAIPVTSDIQLDFEDA